MKSHSAVNRRSMSDSGLTSESPTRGDNTHRRARARSAEFALPKFGASLASPSRPPAATADGRGRAPANYVQNRGTGGGEILEEEQHRTLGELMHQERPTPETFAHMARLQPRKLAHELSIVDSGNKAGVRVPSRISPSTRTKTSGTLGKVTKAPKSKTASPAADQHPAGPRSIRTMPSGPKINGMDNVLMSAYNLEDDKLSSITEALGLGPVHADRHERDMQIAMLGRILRDGVYQGPSVPTANSIAQLEFGRGLPPERLKQLIEVANRASCFITERQQRGKDGEMQQVLQLHFKRSCDSGTQSLASQPNSANYKAVKALAKLMADLTVPRQGMGTRQISIDSVAARMRDGDSSQVFVEHFAQHTQTRPRRVRLAPGHFNEANIRNAWLFTALTPEEKEKLVHASSVSHLQFEERRSTPPNGTRDVKLRIFFGGTENLRDVRQALVSVAGGNGTVFGAVRDAAEIIAMNIERAQREGYRVEFEHIAGASMGGASAQLFTAALLSRVNLQKQPPLVLLDPQLPNLAQLRHAVKGGTIGYDYTKPRGVAVTLDYPAAPRKGLMGRMKGLGFKSPGIVRLKLALSDYDGVRLTRDGELETSPPRPSGPPGMGYHADPDLYLAAIDRFSRRVELR